jgi:hypothetical protein
LDELEQLQKSVARKMERKFLKQETKLNETRFALDQEKKKSAENTQAYNAALEEKDRILQRLREIFN